MSGRRSHHVDYPRNCGFGVRRMRHRVGVLIAFAVVTLAALPAAALEGKTVVLQGLDKVTARVSRLEAPIGATIRFGNLEIVPRACERTPPEEPPESTVYLDITEIRPGEAPVDLFHGWMKLPQSGAERVGASRI